MCTYYYVVNTFNSQLRNKPFFMCSWPSVHFPEGYWVLSSKTLPQMVRLSVGIKSTKAPQQSFIQIVCMHVFVYVCVCVKILVKSHSEDQLSIVLAFAPPKLCNGWLGTLCVCVCVMHARVCDSEGWDSRPLWSLTLISHWTAHTLTHITVPLLPSHLLPGPVYCLLSINY